jgi:hypothetical protein
LRSANARQEQQNWRDLSLTQTAARGFLKYGREFLMFKYYREGTLSLEGLAKKLDVLISEAID